VQSVNSFYIKLLAVVVGTLVVFGILWHRGVLKRLADYVSETREEMRKMQLADLGGIAAIDLPDLCGHGNPWRVHDGRQIS
jgi:hypothetical protein